MENWAGTLIRSSSRISFGAEGGGNATVLALDLARRIEVARYIIIVNRIIGGGDSQGRYTRERKQYRDTELVEIMSSI